MTASVCKRISIAVDSSEDVRDTATQSVRAQRERLQVVNVRRLDNATRYTQFVLHFDHVSGRVRALRCTLGVEAVRRTSVARDRDGLRQESMARQS